MYTINPVMLPVGCVGIKMQYATRAGGAPAGVDIRAAQENQQDFESMTPLKGVTLDVIPQGDALDTWLRSIGIIDIGSVICNEHRAIISMRDPIKEYKELSLLKKGGEASLVLDWLAVPMSPNPEYRYELLSTAALAPMLHKQMCNRRSLRRPVAEIGVKWQHIGTADSGLAICQWLMLQGYGIISLTSDGDPKTPMYRITVKTPWADGLIGTPGYR